MAILRSFVETVCELKVSPVVLFGRTFCPVSPSLQRVPRTAVPRLLGRYDESFWPSVLCSTKTSATRLGLLRSSLASRYPGCTACFVFRGCGLPSGVCFAPDTRTLVCRLSRSGIRPGRPTDLTSFRVAPLGTCPALLPRWSRGHMVGCARDCCLPAKGDCRLTS